MNMNNILETETVTSKEITSNKYCVVTTNFNLPPIPQTTAQAFYNVDVAFSALKTNVNASLQASNTVYFVNEPTSIIYNNTVILTHKGQVITMPEVGKHNNAIFKIQNNTNNCIDFNLFLPAKESFIIGDETTKDFFLAKFASITFVAQTDKWYVVTF